RVVALLPIPLSRYICLASIVRLRPFPHSSHRVYFSFFFFNDPAATEIYTLSLHDALPICRPPSRPTGSTPRTGTRGCAGRCATRSEEHTSELQSRENLVCRLLLEKKKTVRAMAGASISMSKTSMPANFLNRTALPSITGLDANGPISPRPRTAVPLDTTATRLARLV